jgi:uncharacterized protein (DUF58 family)
MTMACVTAAFGVDVGRAESHVLIVATFALLAAALMLTTRYRLTNVVVDARAPRRVAVGEPLAISVQLQNDGDRRHRAIRLELPRLSYDGVWLDRDALIPKLDEGDRERVVVSARFAARGEHRIRPIRVAALVPLRLSQGPTVRTSEVRFVVVPKPARVVQISTLVNRRYQPGGVARASRTGDATDLLGVRPYRPGDPTRDLHARSWARVGIPIVREYQEQYFTRIGVVLDTDRSVSTPADLEAALSLAAGIVANLCRSEALVDLLIVGERVHTVPLGRSLGSLDQALDALAAVAPGPRFSPDGLLARVGPHVGRYSSVVLVALAWDAARESLASAIRVRGIGCVPVVVSGRDPSTAGVRHVSPQAIARGEALSL